MERSVIWLAVLIIIGLTILQTRVFQLGPDLPRTHSVLIFVLMNVNIIFLILLLLLILRNLYQIFFEPRHITGGQLQIKLVVAFVSLSLVPTVFLFYAAFQFIALGHDYWFDSKVEQSLVDSMDLGQYISQVTLHNTFNFGENIRSRIIEDKLYQSSNQARLEEFIRSKREDYRLTLIEVYTPDRRPMARAIASDFHPDLAPPLPSGLLAETVRSNQPDSWIDPGLPGDLIRVFWPVRSESGTLAAFLVVGSRLTAPVAEKMRLVEQGLTRYRELKKIHDPIRVSHYIALTVVALLSVFVSTWIGLHLAKSITGPIMELALATRRIAHGDYNFSIQVASRDREILTLVDSFNRMTRDLKTSQDELERKNIELIESNTELDQRRRYIEIILQSVAAGVISIDAKGQVTTINSSAAEILQARAERVTGQNVREIALPEQQAVLDRLIEAAHASPVGAAERQVKIRIGDRVRTLQIHLTQLKDDAGTEIGLLIVINDLSDLEKAQRMAAWREVARRIAHEIKNPLTPIQLSTQRLRKRYGQRFKDDHQLFDECTFMIIRQVDELKRLVSEFSNFARMPEINPTPNDLAEIVEETLVLYNEGHKDVEFNFHKDPHLPIFNLDRDQMVRVLNNVLDNAVAAVDKQGRIDINLSYDQVLKMARLTVADNGVGLSPEAKSRLFEPYFSTKKSGTGLGLAIVKTIVSDHDGFLRLQDNQPRGTRIIIELPVRS